MRTGSRPLPAAGPAAVAADIRQGLRGAQWHVSAAGINGQEQMGFGARLATAPPLPPAGPTQAIACKERETHRELRCSR